MSKEAMKLALEALKQIDEAMPFPIAKLAQAALREALAEQPAQQEPATVVQSVPMGHGHRDMHYAICDHLPVGTNLYTFPQPAQRAWVGLTDEEFQWIYDHGRTPAGMMELVEAKLKEKNT